MESRSGSQGRRKRTKQDKRRRIMDAARGLFAEYGVGAVTTQQIADRADVAIGTLYLYTSTKAELLILVQNKKFATAIDDGLSAADAAASRDEVTVEVVLAMIDPVVACIREQPENGRTYLHELVSGDPSEPHRRDGLALSLRLQDHITDILAANPTISTADAGTFARVVTSIIHVTTTATVHLHEALPGFLDQIRQQVTVALLRTAHAV